MLSLVQRMPVVRRAPTHCHTRARLGRVTPLDRPRSIYKSEVEGCFSEFWVNIAKFTLKVNVNDPHFQYLLRESQDEYLVQIWWFLLKSVASYCADKPNFLEFWVKTAKMNMKIRVNDPYFQYQLRVSQDACLVQIWWFQPKWVTSSRISSNSESKLPKWYWRSMPMTLIFDINHEYPSMHVWRKFGDSSSNLRRVIVRTC